MEEEVANWVRICGLDEAPAEGQLREAEADGKSLCLARVHGKLSAVENTCPHRQGPLHEGWLEGNAVVCPWHAWAFDLETGLANPPERARVDVFPIRIEGDEVLVELD